jgi:hypothetical protein
MQNTASESTHGKRKFSANATRISEAFRLAAAKQMRRLLSLQAFVSAGKRIVLRLIFGGPDEPPPERVDPSTFRRMLNRKEPK